MEADGHDWTQLSIFKDIPELFKDLQPTWEGFQRLSGARQIGFSSLQPISISEVLSYCVLMGIDDLEDREEFLYFVQFLDKTFLEEMEKRKPPAKGAK